MLTRVRAVSTSEPCMPVPAIALTGEVIYKPSTKTSGIGLAACCASWLANQLCRHLVAGMRRLRPQPMNHASKFMLHVCLQSTAALPFGTIVIILVIWALVTIPLTVLGRHRGQEQPQRVHSPLPHQQVPTGDPRAALVPACSPPDGHGRLPALLRHLHRALLHLGQCVGDTRCVHRVKAMIARWCTMSWTGGKRQSALP